MKLSANNKDEAGKKLATNKEDVNFSWVKQENKYSNGFS